MKRQFRREYGARNRAKTTSKAKDWARFETIKKETRKINRQAYQEFIKDIIAEDTTNNPWQVVKARGETQLAYRSGSSRVMDSLSSESGAKEDFLNDQFFNVFTMEDLDDLPMVEESIHPDMPEITVSENGREP